MALSLKHPFTSAKSDGADATLVQPSNWNASHTVTMAVDNLLGTDSGSTTGKEIPCTTFGRARIAAADIAAWLVATALQATALTWTAAHKFAADFYFTGVITPTTLAADTNDWAPTSFATASRIRAAASLDVNLTGLTAGTEGRVLIVDNIGSFAINFKANSASSTAANRFQIPQDYLLRTDQSVILVYDASTARWRLPTASRDKTSTFQEFLSGAANYTAAEGVTRIRAFAIAGGGGGGSSGAAGGTGGTTTFNSVNATGGAGGASRATASNTPGAGGAGGTGGSGSATLRTNGAAGGVGFTGVNAVSGTSNPDNGPGGFGAPTMLGGWAAPATAGTANTGAGGGGEVGAASGISCGAGAGGGGAGESFELWTAVTPKQVIAYTVAAGGTAAGSAGAGGSGRIRVEEFYD